MASRIDIVGEMSDNVLGLTKYVGWTVNGNQVYGCRGFGEEYKRFWKEFQEYSPVWESDDWPWSYFAFNLDDEAKFQEKWAAIIYEDNWLEENGQEPINQEVPQNHPLSPHAEILENVLLEEVQKEINKEIINTICANVRAD